MTITVQVLVGVTPARAWDLWNGPEHIVKWYVATPTWHTPRASNDLRAGGTFTYRMEAKDGSMGFDYGGTYTAVVPGQSIDSRLGDGRRVSVRFVPEGAGVRVVEDFETEPTHSEEQQRQGWQAILDSFKRYAEQAT